LFVTPHQPSGDQGVFGVLDVLTCPDICTFFSCL